MVAYAVRRILISIPVLIASTFIVFLIVSFSGDPVDRLRELNPPPPPEAIELERERLRMDQPLLQRYWTWITGLARGDFGPSVQQNIDIGDEVWVRLWVTLRLIMVALVIAVLLAILAGVVSAVKQYSKTDYTFTFFGFLFLAMPTFWFAVLLKEAGISFNRRTGEQVFYTIGERSVYIEGGAWDRFMDTLGHMVLPTISLALISFASWSRFQRASMLEVLGSDYVRLARAKGLRWRKVLTRHALRTALIPLTTVTALDIAGIVGGAVVTETVFQWQGMGTFLLTAIQETDAYAVLAWLLIAATVVILFNLVADLLYAVLDPRIRYD